jgi:RIP metalloprotease RseP
VAQVRPQEPTVRLFDYGAKDGEPVVTDRILTIPNVLSLARMAVLPFVYWDLVQGRHLRAFILLAVFATTDWFDGYLARKLDQTSKLGKLLDPISDRVLFVVVGIGMVVEEKLDGVVTPAATAGLRAGDVIAATDGVPVTDGARFSEYIDEHVGDEVRVTVLREGRRVTVTAVPVTDTVDGEERGRLGILTQREFLGRDRLGPIDGLLRGGEELGSMVVRSFQAMGQVFGPEGLSRVGQLLVGEEERSVDDPVGVVGAARFSGQAVQAGAMDLFLALFAFFNVFVGILNLLPLPPLDGGHLAVLGIEALTRRRIDPRRLIPVTAVVAGFLILFTIAITYLDVFSPIPNPFD